MPVLCISYTQRAFHACDPSRRDETCWSGHQPTHPGTSPVLPPCLAGSSEEGSAYLFCCWEAGVRLWTLALSGSERPHPFPTFLAQRGSYLICYTLFSCCLGVEQGRD